MREWPTYECAAWYVGSCNRLLLLTSGHFMDMLVLRPWRPTVGKRPFLHLPTPRSRTAGSIPVTRGRTVKPAVHFHGDNVGYPP